MILADENSNQSFKQRLSSKFCKVLGSRKYKYIFGTVNVILKTWASSWEKNKQLECNANKIFGAHVMSPTVKKSPTNMKNTKRHQTQINLVIMKYLGKIRIFTTAWNCCFFFFFLNPVKKKKPPEGSEKACPMTISESYLSFPAVQEPREAWQSYVPQGWGAFIHPNKWETTKVERHERPGDEEPRLNKKVTAWFLQKVSWESNAG